jgi:predicted acyl esterase
MTDVTQARLELNLPIELRDGAVTRANVWRPAGGEPVPAILVRSPYTREQEEITLFCEPRVALPQGFAVVSQDVRGRGGSDGQFDPFVQEGRDGYDTIEQVAAMEWCSGDVVMAGNSYVGATQWLAAVEAPPHLRAIAPGLTSDRYDEGWTYRAGVIELGFMHSWIGGVLGPQDSKRLDDVEHFYTARDELIEMAPWCRPWFEQPPGSPYWESVSIAARRERVNVPSLNIGGWYDIFLDGTLRNFHADMHPDSRLIVGPWGHDDFPPHLVGDRNLGFAGSGGAYGLFAKELEFFRAAIDGRASALPRVSAYMLGARRWLELEAWPPPGATTVSLPVGETTFRHDPENLPASVGGRCLYCNTAGGPGWGQYDQRPIVGHPGVRLMELGAPPSRRLAGPVTAVLEVGADGSGVADWVCTLCMRDADGALLNLCEGVMRSAAVGNVSVELGDVCVELEPGQQLALLVAGASYPRWEPLPEARTQRIVRGSALRLTVI